MVWLPCGSQSQIFKITFAFYIISLFLVYFLHFASAGSKIQTCCYNNSSRERALKGALYNWCSLYQWSVATLWWCICHCNRNRQSIAWPGICPHLQTIVKGQFGTSNVLHYQAYVYKQLWNITEQYWLPIERDLSCSCNVLPSLGIVSRSVGWCYKLAYDSHTRVVARENGCNNSF